jgi:hypothetical protein
MMMHNPRTSPRNEYLQREKIRVEASPSIAEKFPELKSLTVDLAYYDQAGRSRSSQIKYTVNLEHAKSAFQFGCHNHECVGGNFDLSIVLSQATAARQINAEGEVRCEGWRSRTVIDTVPCHNLLRYKLTLEY